MFHAVYNEAGLKKKINKLTSQYSALWALCSLEAHTGQGYKCVVCKRSLISNSTWQRQFANSITMQSEGPKSIS